MLRNSQSQRYSLRRNRKAIATCGSQRNRPKKYQNNFLKEVILRKLKRGYKPDDNQRKGIWIQFTDCFESTNLYLGLKELQLPPQTLMTIQKDVKRTHLSVETKEMHMHAKLKQEHTAIFRGNVQQVLEQFAKYNPYIGYCQGMNNIVAFFLEEGLTTEEVFFVFKRISQVLLPTDYYSSMDSVVTYARIMFEMLFYTHPKVHKKMRQIISEVDAGEGLMLTMSTVFQWFVCLFTNSNLNKKIRLIVVQYFMLQGVPALFKAALAFFDCFQSKIVQVNQFEEYIRVIEDQANSFEDAQRLQKRMNETYIDSHILNLLKQKLSPTEQRKMQNLDSEQQVKKCDRKWNSCLQKLNDNSSAGVKTQFFVFKASQNVQIIDNFLEKIHTKFFNNSKLKSAKDQLIIGRMFHVCRQTSQTCTQDSFSDKFKSSQKNPSEISESDQKWGQSPQKVSDFDRHVDYRNKNADFERQNRSKIVQKMQKAFEQQRRSVFKRSQSMQFMRMMVQNQSFSNLLDLMQKDDTSKMFQKDIQEEEQGDS